MLADLELIEGNRFIAEFMDFSKSFPNMDKEIELSNLYYRGIMDRQFYEGLYTSQITMTSAEGIYYHRSLNESNHLKDLDFHKSWDWLMPVCTKN